MARNISYVESVPSLFDDEALSDMLAGYKGLDEKQIMDKLIYTKSDHWAHEREWRIYSGRGRTAALYEDIPFNPAELDGVIFGARMRREDRRWLAEMLRTFYPHVQLLEANTKLDAYELAILIAPESEMVVPTLSKILLFLEVFLERVPTIVKSRLSKAIRRKP